MNGHRINRIGASNIWYRKFNQTIGLWTRNIYTHICKYINIDIPFADRLIMTDGKWQIQMPIFVLLFWFFFSLFLQKPLQFSFCDCDPCAEDHDEFAVCVIWIIDCLFVHESMLACLHVLQIKFGRWWLGWLANRKPCFFSLLLRFKEERRNKPKKKAILVIIIHCFFFLVQLLFRSFLQTIPLYFESSNAIFYTNESVLHHHSFAMIHRKELFKFCFCYFFFLKEQMCKEWPI